MPIYPPPGPTLPFQADGPIKTSDYTPEGDSGGNGLVDVDKPADLKQVSRQKLGSYLKTVTSQNHYRVSDNTTPPVVSSPGSLGTPPIPDESSSASLNSFLSQALEDARNNFNSLSSNNPELAAVIDKNSQIMGHSLLNVDVESSDGAFQDADKPEQEIGNVPTKISASLKSNRFSQGASFRTRRESSGNTQTIQRRFGEFMAAPDAGDELVVKNLAGIGEELIARAGTALSIATGTKVDVQRFNAREAYRGVETGQISTLFGGVPQIDGEASSMTWATAVDGGEDGFTSHNLKSNGSVNSPGVPFSGIGSIEMKGFALASAIGVLALSAVASGVIDLIELTVKDNLFVHTEETAISNDLPLGQSSGRNSYGYNSLGRYFFKLIGTNNGSRSETSRIFATLVGTVQFYSQVVGASQGYYLSVNRNVFRDLERLERVIEQSKHMFQGDNRNFPAGGAIALGILESINILLETLGSSQTFKFANAMANLGDICILSGRGGFDRAGDDAPTVNLRSDILPLLKEPRNLLDSKNPTVRNIHEKSRAQFDRSKYNGHGHGGGKGLAWRFGAYSSAYIAPVTATLAVGSESKSLVTDINNSYLSNKQSGESKFKRSTGKDAIPGRISTEDRKKLEDELNSAHMPFYFHDVRTNEIISFWAFLESLSDSFTPEINSVSGFGRMDNVQIYKRTGRSISLTFMAVATNPEDFDEMWFAINKLVTLVYPQYSRGSQRESTTGDKFIMPFSQIPTASPLIRLRVGDLITSNRNPITERRNFGVGTESFSPKPEAASAATSSPAASQIPGPSPTVEALKERFAKAHKEGDTGIIPALRFSPSQDTVLIDPENVRKKLRVKDSIYRLKLTSQTIRGKITGAAPLEKAKNGLEEGSWVYTVEITEDLENPKHQGQTVYATIQDLKPDVSQLSRAKADERLTNADAEANASYADITKFMDRESGTAGPIIRAFDSAGGEGLAGMITQLDFDWLLNTMLWDTTEGRRAPMGCKITIGFTPIHDHQIGLTDMGEISAPAYMVGKNIRDYFQKSGSTYLDPNDTTKAEAQAASDSKSSESAAKTSKL